MGSSSSALSAADSSSSDNATTFSNSNLKNAVIFETGEDNPTGNLGLLKTILPFLLVAFSVWWLNTQLR
ncbi:hypothetical protein CHS0354_009185, partial [Potamilus streckersoni]